jgi:hypothetical protein
MEKSLAAAGTKRLVGIMLKSMRFAMPANWLKVARPI